MDRIYTVVAEVFVAAVFLLDDVVDHWHRRLDWIRRSV
jgi:hypothetical protein